MRCLKQCLRASPHSLSPALTRFFALFFDPFSPLSWSLILVRFTAFGELFAKPEFHPLSSIAVQSRIIVNSPRQSYGRYAGFTNIPSIDSADTVMMFKS